MLYYDLNGKFLHEEKMSTFYSGIACVQSDLIEVNRRKDLNNMAFVKDLGRGGVRKYVPFSKKEELFESFGTVFPYIVQSEHTYITLPSESTIYQFNGEGVYPKYFIDFGRHTIPESQFGNGNTAKKIYRDAQRNWDGISISNFRECKDHICFTYGNSVVVIYSKKDKTARTFTVALNTLGFLPFQNYFGHDGDDNNLISIYESSTFREQMKAFKGDSVIWGKEAEEIKHIEGLVKDNDNPLLLVCNLKPSL
jgi:hypothetical protein